MADNVDVTEGSGKTVASDDIQVDGSHSQGQVQFVKIVDGTLNGTGSIRVNQAAKANAMTVAPASDISDATYIGDIKFGESLPAGTNAIGKLAANSGVDIGDVTLTAGTAAIGKLAANTGVDIGDVDVTSVIAGVGATNLGKARDSALGATDTGVMALAVRDDTLTTLTPVDGDYVPLRVGSTGKLHVTDANITACNTGAVVISSGTVTTVSTVTNLSQLGGTAITMDEGVHDAGCQRVTIATDDDGVLSLGIIDDWDSTHDSAASADGPQLMAAYDSTKPTAVGDGDAVRMLADAYGRLLIGVEPQAFQAVFDSGDASGEGNAVHASAASTIIVVQSYIISVDAEIWVKLQEENSSALTGKFWLKAGGGVAITLPKNAPIVLGVDSDLEVITEGAGSVSVSVTGYTIPG